MLAFYGKTIELGNFVFITKYINYAFIAGSPLIWVVYPYLAGAYNKIRNNKVVNNNEVKHYLKIQINYSFLFFASIIGILVLNKGLIVPLIVQKNI